MRHHIWAPLEMQGIDRFDEGAAVLRMRFRTAPVMQWDVARAFNLLLKQRREAQGLDLGMPRLSVSMEGRPGDPMTDEPGQNDGDPATLRDAKGRAPGEAGIADPEGETNPQRASPDSS